MKLEDNPLLLLPKNFEEKIPRFYEQRGKEQIEEYAKQIEREYKIDFRLIAWDDRKGLVNISNTPSTGLDLQERRFVPHNIWDLTSEFAEPVVKVVLVYISLLEFS